MVHLGYNKYSNSPLEIEIQIVLIVCIEKFSHPAFIEMLGGMKKSVSGQQQGKGKREDLLMVRFSSLR